MKKIIISILTLVALSIILISIFTNTSKEDVVIEETEMTSFEYCMQDESIQNQCKCVAEKNFDYCGLSVESDFGFWQKAKITKDKKYCDELKEANADYWDLHNCYIDTAKTIEDCQAIDYSNEPYEINECMAYVTGNASYCKNKTMPIKDREACLGTITKDLSHCNNSVMFGRKWSCIFENTNDPNICENYHLEYCTHFYINNGGDQIDENILDSSELCDIDHQENCITSPKELLNRN